jgi:lipid-binding SYLF domain-containing protein
MIRTMTRWNLFKSIEVDMPVAQLYAIAAADAARRAPRRVARGCAKSYDGRAQSKGEFWMKKIWSFLISLGLLAAPLANYAAPDDNHGADRLKTCGEVMSDIMDLPDNIPPTLLDKSVCVVVVPSVIKAAFLGGGLYGRGAMSCRGGDNFDGPWSAPSMMRVEGGSFGAQAGVQATDLVLLIMNVRGAESILTSKVKIGGDASAAAGPVGRAAEADTDASMRAEILSYSRARGLFAGVAIVGSTLRQDDDANAEVYGKELSATDIVRGGVVAATPEGQQLISVLEKHSPQPEKPAK